MSFLSLHNIFAALILSIPRFCLKLIFSFFFLSTLISRVLSIHSSHFFSLFFFTDFLSYSAIIKSFPTFLIFPPSFSSFCLYLRLSFLLSLQRHQRLLPKLLIPTSASQKRKKSSPVHTFEAPTTFNF